MPKSKVENDIVEKQKIISSLTLMDDLFMKVVLQDKECTEYILQTIMDDSTLKLKRQSLQKNLSNLHGHSLVLDCLCEDGNNNIYNIEIQNNISGAEPKRARYHAGLMDMHYLKKEIIFRNYLNPMLYLLQQMMCFMGNFRFII